MKCICCLLAMLCIAATSLKRITNANGDTLAVVVPARTKLMHIPQFSADDLTAHHVLEDVVKVNVVASTPEAADAARQMIRAAFPAGARPALSVVVGSVPHGKLLAADYTILGGRDDPRTWVYISGQAEKGASPAEATAKTLASLVETLQFAGCTAEDVVQAKFFATADVRPMELREEFKKVFGNHRVSIVLVEWKSELPVEIELVALGDSPQDDAPPLEHLTPPGKTASPLFTRVVRVNRGDLIYIGSLYSSKAGSGEVQVLSIFDQLQEVLAKTGSDLRHLVKATYYVSDNDASRQLNALRPKFYDPARPPAASKAMVSGVGMPGRTISIDMIAVPTTQPTSAKP